MKHGFIKVAAASPVIKVADADYNAGRIIECIKEAGEKGVKLLVFPELSITGVSCYDLIGHRVILEGAKEALLKIVKATAGMDMLIFVGLPLAVGSRLYSCAAAICGGAVLGYCIQAFFGVTSPISAPYFWIALALLTSRLEYSVERKECLCGKSNSLP